MTLMTHDINDRIRQTDIAVKTFLKKGCGKIRTPQWEFQTFAASKGKEQKGGYK